MMPFGRKFSSSTCHPDFEYDSSKTFVKMMIVLENVVTFPTDIKQYKKNLFFFQNRRRLFRSRKMFFKSMHERYLGIDMLQNICS